MTLDTIRDSLLPSLLLGSIFGLGTLYLDVQELKTKMKEHLSNSKSYNDKQWKYIVESHDDIIVLQEELKCRSK